MTKGQGIFAGLALVAAAIAAVGLSSLSRAGETGPWQISAGSDQTAWRINTQTGATSFCSLLPVPPRPACRPVEEQASAN